MDLKKTPPTTTRERMIESAFGWLRDVDTIEVDGKRMMVNKGDNKPYNVADIIKESDFIRDWLMLFALGREHGLNYFPTQEWIDLSGDGLQSVMVVDDNNRPLFLIPPLVTTNMGPEHQKMLRDLEQAIKQIAADEQLKHLPDASAHLAHHVENGLASVKPKLITDMVPQWYYAKHQIIPEVEKQVNYIRQVVNPRATVDDLNKARPILYRAFKKEPVTADEKKFITELTDGLFKFEESTSETAVKQNEAKDQDEPDQEFDPLEC
jgi:hypothetical protein